MRLTNRKSLGIANGKRKEVGKKVCHGTDVPVTKVCHDTLFIKACI
jgi:hypothetical protein